MSARREELVWSFSRGLSVGPSDGIPAGQRCNVGTSALPAGNNCILRPNGRLSAGSFAHTGRNSRSRRRRFAPHRLRRYAHGSRRDIGFPNGTHCDPRPPESSEDPTGSAGQPNRESCCAYAGFPMTRGLPFLNVSPSVKRLIETVKLMTLPYTHTSYEQEYISIDETPWIQRHRRGIPWALTGVNHR